MDLERYKFRVGLSHYLVVEAPSDIPNPDAQRTASYENLGDHFNVILTETVGAGKKFAANQRQLSVGRGLRYREDPFKVENLDLGRPPFTYSIPLSVTSVPGVITLRMRKILPPPRLRLGTKWAPAEPLYSPSQASVTRAENTETSAETEKRLLEKYGLDIGGLTRVLNFYASEGGVELSVSPTGSVRALQKHGDW